MPKQQIQTSFFLPVPKFIISEHHLSNEPKYPVREDFHLRDNLHLLSNTDQCRGQNDQFSKERKRNICTAKAK